MPFQAPLTSTPCESLVIEIFCQVASKTKFLPHPEQLQTWVKAALPPHLRLVEITIRVVDDTESAELNARYRQKQGPTNVLSFSYDVAHHPDCELQGDLIICAPQLEKEAQAADKALLAHWAHLVIHGTLHLLGYDHERAQDACVMEGLETQLMMNLGFPPPYGVDET